LKAIGGRPLIRSQTPDRVSNMKSMYLEADLHTTSSADCRLVPARHVSTTVHGTRTVLLDPLRGRYIGLDEVAGRIWQLAQRGASLCDTVTRVVEEYDIDRETADRDVRSTFEKLSAMGVAEVRT